MLRSICLNIVKTTAVLLCLGIGASACWVHGDVAVHREHRSERHEDRR